MTGRKIALWMLTGGAAVVPMHYGLNYLNERRVYDWTRRTDDTGGARAVRGTLVVSVFGDDDRPAGSESAVHRTVFVNGPDYSGMEDNDLRGYLDGRFKFGWNQPTQVHVRIGRRDNRPRYGELELFRVLHRWSDVMLPPAARVREARMRLTVENGPPFPVEMYLYQVNKDWNPGQGGERHDNLSPPRTGEVGWQDVGYKEQTWGLPGSGFASNDHPDADTPVMPLASAWYKPGESHIEFSSKVLAHYVTQRVNDHQPLLFLLKLSDDHEDSFGTVTTLYSGNHGDGRSVDRRPQLLLEWVADNEILRSEKRVFLEHGRSCEIELGQWNHARTIAADFRTLDGYDHPPLEFQAKTNRPWRRLTRPITLDAANLRLRVIAATDPITLGQPFVASLRDTWVLTAPPAKQEVIWTFRSPSGRDHRIVAHYDDDFTWSVRFLPNEIGRWRFQWTQEFAEKPFESAPGLFDVLGGDEASLREQLEVLRDRILESPLTEQVDRVDAFGLAFTRLERAALRSQTPDSYRSESGASLRALLDDVRAALAGKHPPDNPEPRPDKRHW